jgi:TatD DNase family protein
VRRTAFPAPAMYFDSHLHLTDGRFAGEAQAVVERARAAGVSGMVVVASDEEDAAAALALARAHDLHCTAGIHPHHAERFDAGFRRVRELAAEPRVVALGETGLDYHYDNAPRPLQRAAFEAHLALAAETGLPVVVHSRDADDDTVAMIRSAATSVTGVLHCFSAGRPVFEAALAADWYVSFSGLITFPKYATPDLVAATPGDRLLIETDSPYLAPVPHRGRRNEPAWVVEVARRVARLRGEPLEVVAAATTGNALTFYRLG